jgi:hypothetical protein
MADKVAFVGAGSGRPTVAAMVAGTAEFPRHCVATGSDGR